MKYGSITVALASLLLTATASHAQDPPDFVETHMLPQTGAPSSVVSQNSSVTIVGSSADTLTFAPQDGDAFGVVGQEPDAASPNGAQDVVAAPAFAQKREALATVETAETEAPDEAARDAAAYCFIPCAREKHPETSSLLIVEPSGGWSPSAAAATAAAVRPQQSTRETAFQVGVGMVAAGLGGVAVGVAAPMGEESCVGLECDREYSAANGYVAASGAGLAMLGWLVMSASQP